MIDISQLEGGFPPDEARRVASLKEGSTAAWEALYNEYHAKLQRYAWARLRSAADAEDVAASTFSRAVEAIDRYEYRGASIAAWLYSIARNVIRERQRLLQRQVQHPGEGLGDLGELMTSMAIDETLRIDQRLDLIESFGKLTHDQQEVLTLVYAAGFSVREIADMLGKTERAIYYTQARGLFHLKKLISEEI